MGFCISVYSIDVDEFPSDRSVISLISSYHEILIEEHQNLRSIELQTGRLPFNVTGRPVNFHKEEEKWPSNSPLPTPLWARRIRTGLSRDMNSQHGFPHLSTFIKTNGIAHLYGSNTLTNILGRGGKKKKTEHMNFIEVPTTRLERK